MARVTFTGVAGTTYYVAVDGPSVGGGSAGWGQIRLALSDFGTGGADLPPGAVGMLDFVTGTFLWGSTQFVVDEVIDHPEYMVPGVGMYVVGYELVAPYVDQVGTRIIQTDMRDYILAGDFTLVIEGHSPDYLQPVTLFSSAPIEDPNEEYISWFEWEPTGFFLWYDQLTPISPPPRPWREVYQEDSGTTGQIVPSYGTVVLTRTNAGLWVATSFASFPGPYEDTQPYTGAYLNDPDRVYLNGGPDWSTTWQLIRRIVIYPPQTPAAMPALAVETMPPPPNDDFVNAIQLALNVHVTGHNILSTKEVGEPNHAGFACPHTVWYKFVPTTTAVHNVLIGEGSGVFGDFYGDGPAVGVYTGTAVNALTEIASGVDWPGLTLPFTATAGITYYIAVTGADNVNEAVSPFKIGVELA